MSRSTRRDNYRDNNRIIAGLLAFIGGTFGIHRFYLNDIGGGIFYIFLFFITSSFFPVTMVLGIIEALRLFNMSPEAFDEKYNKKGKVRGKSRRFQQRERPQYRKERSNGSRRVPRERTNGGSRPKQERGRYVKKRQTIPKRNPFKTSGMDKYKDFDLEEAIVDFNKALKIAERDPEIHFYLAAVYSLTEQKDKAYKHLELAVKYGLKNKSKIDTYDDLAFVRIQDEWDEFRANGYKMKKETPKEKEVPKDEAAPKEKEAPEDKEEVLDDDILLSQLNKLDELKKRGLISKEEFLIEKEKLLDHRK